jgi:GNAT acetyltransferase-like protein
MADVPDADGKAELLADGGAAAESEEFFRSCPFFDAEEVTHTLRIVSGDLELVAPLIVRDIPNTSARDAISPYGYPGIVAANSVGDGRRGESRRSLPAVAPADTPPTPLLDPEDIDWSSTDLVSIFIRHTLAEPPPLAAAAERNVVQIADPALPPKSRSSDRNRINKNRRAGYEVELVAGPETTAEQRAGFLAAYEQTMHRTAAAERYFFGAAHFNRLLESPRTWLALAHAPGGDVAAASLTVRSDGSLHYYLSGSADAHLRDSPMKNVVAALVELSTELCLPLNLGGGLARGDALEEFKRGFANREQAWRVSEIVCDRAAYDRLSAGRDRTDFFPKYRSS